VLFGQGEAWRSRNKPVDQEQAASRDRQALERLNEIGSAGYAQLAAARLRS
jgi:hypothetical protein